MALRKRTNRPISESIEAELYDINRRLKAHSAEDQARLFDKERDNISTMVRSVLDSVGGSLFGWFSSSLMTFFDVDPFKWFYFEEHDHNARFASREASIKSLYDALEQIGQILEEKQRPHLKRISKRFSEKVASVADGDRVADSVIRFCKCLPSARNGSDLLINVNDVKLLLMENIKFLLRSTTTPMIESLRFYPIILPSGEICWVKYMFASNMSVERCIEKKFCDIDVTIWYYWFPDERRLGQVLRQSFSNPSLYDAMKKAGESLQKKQSPHLKKISKRFLIVRPNDYTTELVRAANDISRFCTHLVITRNGSDLPIKVNDVKPFLPEVVKFLVQSKTNDSFEFLDSFPLILRSGELLWVKYQFAKIIPVNSKNYYHFEVIIWYYWFPNESDFRQVLRRIELDS